MAMDYYTMTFARLHRELVQRNFHLSPPPIREEFWSTHERRLYTSGEGRSLILKYAEAIEADLKAGIEKRSFAYWLHSYRRLGVSYPEADENTVMLIRATLEAAFQKYGLGGMCGGIGWSNEVDESEVLKGAFHSDNGKLAPLFKLSESRQMVLLDFGSDDLVELYGLESLAHEMWRCAATLRILGKGAGLRVTDGARAFQDDRSDELHSAVVAYDDRLGHFESSATGTVFDVIDEADGYCCLPAYNVSQYPIEDFADFFESFGGQRIKGSETNFVWSSFNLRGFAAAHQPFGEEFNARHGVSLNDVLVVLGALVWRVMLVWRENSSGMLGYWQRAYEVLSEDHMKTEIGAVLPLSLAALRDGREPSDVNVEKALSFWEMSDAKRADIDVLLHMPYRPLVPIRAGEWILDYAWIFQALYGLFFQLAPANQNFKGEALEVMIQRGAPPIQTRPITRQNGEQRQVDASFAVGRTLVIAECKAFAMSAGTDRGDEAAIRYRLERINAALDEVFSKAQWLANEPRGRNFDVTSFNRIVPIVITPFVEFLPERTTRYWLREGWPRVLTPRELSEALSQNIFDDDMSAIQIRRDD